MRQTFTGFSQAGPLPVGFEDTVKLPIEPDEGLPFRMGLGFPAIQADIRQWIPCAGMSPFSNTRWLNPDSVKLKGLYTITAVDWQNRFFGKGA